MISIHLIKNYPTQQQSLKKNKKKKKRKNKKNKKKKSKHFDCANNKRKNFRARLKKRFK